MDTLKKTAATILFIVVFSGVGLLAGSLIGNISNQLEGIDRIPFWGLLLILLGAGYAAIIIHEIGHLIGGRLVNFKFVLFAAGPIQIVRRGEKLVWSLNRNIGNFGGIAASVPEDTVNVRQRLLSVVAGGPLASLISAIVAGLVAYLVWEWNGTLALINLFYTFMSMGIFIITAIPGTPGGMPTDGKQWLSLRRGGEDVEHRMLVLSLSAQSLAGVRPRDLDAHMLAKIHTLNGQQIYQLSGYLLQYFSDLDAGRIDSARDWLTQIESNISHMPVGFRQMFFLELAYFAARFDGNPARGRELLRQASGGFIEKQTRLRAESAVLLGEGKVVEALNAARDGLLEAQKSYDLGAAIAEKEWLQSMLNEAEARLAYS